MFKEHLFAGNPTLIQCVVAVARFLFALAFHVADLSQQCCFLSHCGRRADRITGVVRRKVTIPMRRVINQDST